jgi:broad specificity phosphatase PhoE
MGHLILVRHSTTEASAAGRNLGQRSDPPLSGTGVALAERLGSVLAAELARLPVAQLRMVTSPARRCRETIAAIAHAIGGPDEPEVEAGLVEIDYGDWDGLTEAECLARDPGPRAAWEADPFRTRIPDGESGSDVVARAFPALDAIDGWLGEDRARTAVVVSHNHVIRLRLTALLGWPMAAYRRRIAQEPGGYSIVAISGTAPTIRRVNVEPG